MKFTNGMEQMMDNFYTSGAFFTVGDMEKTYFSFRDFSFRNFNLDGIGRFALVWNNSRWYAGTSCILHSYNYRKSRFSTNNVFGSFNIYFGYNFGKRKEYR